MNVRKNLGFVFLPETEEESKLDEAGKDFMKVAREITGLGDTWWEALEDAAKHLNDNGRLEKGMFKDYVTKTIVVVEEPFK